MTDEIFQKIIPDFRTFLDKVYDLLTGMIPENRPEPEQLPESESEPNTRKMNPLNLEYRLAMPISDIDTKTGLVMAYLTKWDTIDSYNSTFKQGSFAKTFATDKVKFFWNHYELCGKIVSMKEDEVGPLILAQFNLDTEAGKKAWAHVKARDVDSFSFGFNTVRSEIINNIQVISEIKLYECGPVIFPSNPKAEIIGYRETVQPIAYSAILEALENIQKQLKKEV